MNGMWTMRWVLLALAALLAGALLWRGNVVIGGILGVIVAVRAVFLVQLHRRRTELRQRFQERRAGRF